MGRNAAARSQARGIVTTHRENKELTIMAHDLDTTTNGEAMMAYQGETPWHALGTRVDTMDVPTALAAAHLDWTVELEHMFLQNGAKVPARRAAVRSTDKRVLSVVSDRYEVLQNSDAFGVLQPACEQFGVSIETAGALGKGDKVWMLAKMPASVEPVAGDKIDGYCLIMTGHNGYTPYTGRLTTVRVVCRNTLSLALKDAAFTRLTHTKSSVATLDQVATLITDMTEALNKNNETFAALAKKKMDRKAISRYIQKVLGVKVDSEMQGITAARHAAIMELATGKAKGYEFAPGTAWAAFNAVTEYVDHIRPTEVKAPRAISQANASAIFGTNSKLKVRALAMAA